jgi:hypothetical protein
VGRVSLLLRRRGRRVERPNDWNDMYDCKCDWAGNTIVQHERGPVNSKSLSALDPAVGNP